MKKTYLSAAITAAILSPVILTALFRNTRTRLFAVAMSLATFTPVFGQPVITTQPQWQTNIAGTTAAFSVTATGALPLSYQWRKSSSNLGGATNDTLILPNVQSSDQAIYAVVVTNSEGSVTSALARLYVLFPSSITSQPKDQIV